MVPGPNIGRYPTRELSPEQERLFEKEVDGWIEQGWPVEHSAEAHGEPISVPPLIAKMQEHKPSTPCNHAVISATSTR